MKLGTALGLVAVVTLTSCRNLDRFDTAKGEAYCGNIVAAGFIKEGFGNDLRMRVTLDTSKLTSTPGTISVDDAAKGPCTSGNPKLDHAPMVVGETIFHDQLSTFDFGEGRDQNFIAWVESSCQGPMVAVVSLMKNDDIEVRLMKPPPAADAGVVEAGAGVTGAADAGAPGPGFGLFQLTRQKGDCGF